MVIVRLKRYGQIQAIFTLATGIEYNSDRMYAKVTGNAGHHAYSSWYSTKENDLIVSNKTLEQIAQEEATNVHHDL